ncbi:MAG: hypothetical protein K0R89_15 [Ramlibacter sp.]|jgi:hypothetical protein|nr:hypothetical protein [Ramlibacter sp.]
MSTVFFLPWVRLKEPVTLGDVQLIPYQRNQQPGSLGNVTQLELDELLGNYGERSYNPGGPAWAPIQAAVLVHWRGTVFGADVPDNEISGRMLTGEMLAVAALAARQYGNFLAYVNRDQVRMIGQTFEPIRPRAVLAVSRRRDGGTNHMLHRTDGGPEFIRPLHVDRSSHLEVDEHLFVALQGCIGDPQWAHVREAILVFNSANTDSDSVSDELELVLMRIAFEALLRADHTVSDLSQRLRSELSMTAPLREWPVGEFDAAKWRSRWTADRPITAWVQDFCAARNRSAHAKTAGSEAPVWSDRNHLMFSSWLLPLVLKAVLAREGRYTLGPYEADCLQMCELFLAADVSSYRKEEVRLRWSEVEEEISSKELERYLSGI